MASLLLCAFLFTSSGSTLAADNQSNLVTYSYDDLNRLTKVQYQNGPTIQYIYDAAGNITSIKQLPSSLYGDVNEDSGVNMADAVLILKHITNPTVPFPIELL